MNFFDIRVNAIWLILVRPLSVCTLRKYFRRCKLTINAQKETSYLVRTLYKMMLIRFWCISFNGWRFYFVYIIMRFITISGHLWNEIVLKLIRKVLIIFWYNFGFNAMLFVINFIFVSVYVERECSKFFDVCQLININKYIRWSHFGCRRKTNMEETFVITVV